MSYTDPYEGEDAIKRYHDMVARGWNPDSAREKVFGSGEAGKSQMREATVCREIIQERRDNNERFSRPMNEIGPGVG